MFERASQRMRLMRSQGSSWWNLTPIARWVELVKSIAVRPIAARSGPTASAIVADLMDIARGFILPAFSAPAESLEPAAQAPVGLRAGSYYLRLMVVDKPGVVADIAGVMRDENVSLESMIQRGRSPARTSSRGTHGRCSSGW